jgi:hypothetical protein
VQRCLPNPPLQIPSLHFVVAIECECYAADDASVDYGPVGPCASVLADAAYGGEHEGTGAGYGGCGDWAVTIWAAGRHYEGRKGFATEGMVDER